MKVYFARIAFLVFIISFWANASLSLADTDRQANLHIFASKKEECLNFLHTFPKKESIGIIYNSDYCKNLPNDKKMSVAKNKISAERLLECLYYLLGYLRQEKMSIEDKLTVNKYINVIMRKYYDLPEWGSGNVVIINTLSLLKSCIIFNIMGNSGKILNEEWEDMPLLSVLKLADMLKTEYFFEAKGEDAFDLLMSVYATSAVYQKIRKEFPDITEFKSLSLAMLRDRPLAESSFYDNIYYSKKTTLALQCLFSTKVYCLSRFALLMDRVKNKKAENWFLEFQKEFLKKTTPFEHKLFWDGKKSGNELLTELLGIKLDIDAKAKQRGFYDINYLQSKMKR